VPLTKLCYCTINAGGNPCNSREHCDYVRGLQLKIILLKKEADDERAQHTGECDKIEGSI